VFLGALGVLILISFLLPLKHMPTEDKDGILVACSHHIEWLLPWWWDYYSQHNDLPVTFVDFGITDSVKKWCEKRGERIPLLMKDEFIAGQEKIEPKLAELWEILQGNKRFWPARSGWFKKPFALLQSPYQRTLWLDLDCQVRAPLASLFEKCENPAGIALVRDPFQFTQGLDGYTYPDEVLYNSGVIVYKKGSPIIDEWAEKTTSETADFLGDQNILSRVLFLRKEMFCELPLFYNWLSLLGEQPQAAIFHFSGPEGKEKIQKELALAASLF
jgi:hypothetical protein